MANFADRLDLVLTAHGRARARQRGLPDASLLALLDCADRAIPVGDGCIAVSASAEALAVACVEGLPAAMAGRLIGRVLALDERERIVTALVARGPRGRRYNGRGSNARSRLRGRGR